MEKPNIAEVHKVEKEAEETRTIFIKHDMKARPGQFVMVWIPGVDEKPFAISYLKKGKIGITVSAIGPFSKSLYAKKPGERLGVRGPYGTSYNLGDSKSIVMVGGGYGSASLTMLSEKALEKGLKVKFILGARTEAKLVFEERIKKLIGEENLIITTDDGSRGKKGFVTHALKDIIGKTDKVFACGPDKMMKSVAEMCIGKVDGEVSMERWMKCGFGLCGHCCMDPSGARVCVEGPVMNFKDALKLSEFGEYHRTQSSKKEKL
jgi:dihydroorotate dehydrogenase electron transfer subunit